MTLRVGFTGTRNGMTDRQLEGVALTLSACVWIQGATEFHHGDCVGADEQAHSLALRFREQQQLKGWPGLVVVVHPPRDSVLRAWCSEGDEYRPELGYLERDRNIVDAVDWLIAAPGENGLRGGTGYTYRYALNQGKGIWVVRMDGRRITIDPRGEKA